MTIATMEDLEALPSGTSVRVAARRLGTRTFIRTEQGFEADGGVVVDPKFFAGHIAAGQVTNWTTGTPESGDHFIEGTTHYIVLSVADGMVWMMQFRRGVWRTTLSRTVEQVREFTWQRVLPDRRPDWHDMAYALGMQMRGVEAESLRVAEQWNESQRLLGEANLNLTRMREARAAQVQVVVTGVSRLPVEKATGHVPDKVSVVDVLASWRREFTVTTAPAPGCQCGMINRDEVAKLLGIQGATEHADFGFQVDCGRH